MSAHAGINPDPLDFACCWSLLHNRKPDRCIAELRDVDDRILIGTRWVFDFVAIAFGQVYTCGRLAQMSGFLALGLRQIRLHETANSSGVRTSEIREADSGRVRFDIHRFILSVGPAIASTASASRSCGAPRPLFGVDARSLGVIRPA